jgi:hypothetical protein
MGPVKVEIDLYPLDRAERCRHDETVVFGIKELGAVDECGVKG